MWWLVIASLLFLAWFAYQLLGPNPPIRVSKQTTYVTEPLRPNGLPDYREYVRDKLRDGVTQENNAAALMWQVLGPGTGSDAVEPAEWQQIVKELRLAPAASDTYLTEPAIESQATVVGDWIYRNSPEWKHAAAADQSVFSDPLLSPRDLGYESISRTMSAPRQTGDLQPLADWVQANNSAIDLLVEASQRSRFYSPLPPRKSDDKDSLLESLPMNSIMRYRAIARILVTRAMLHVGEGRPAQAWRDLYAIHRWARFIGQRTIARRTIGRHRHRRHRLSR